MTNEQKAIRLEELAKHKQNRGESLAKGIASDIALSDAALLRESAQIWREQEGVRWEDSERRCVALYKRHILICRKSLASADYYWDAMRITISAWPADGGSAPTLDAAKAAAVAWVDQQEGKQND